MKFNDYLKILGTYVINFLVCFSMYLFFSFKVNPFIIIIVSNNLSLSYKLSFDFNKTIVEDESRLLMVALLIILHYFSRTRYGSAGATGVGQRPSTTRTLDFRLIGAFNIFFLFKINTFSI